jgi:hypothetical protein
LYFFLFTINTLITSLFIDVGTYSLSIAVSIYDFYYFEAITYLLLYLKFLLFFRVFQSFGIYFAIIIGVAKKVFPFLVVLFFILLGFAHAFFTILKSIDLSDGNTNKFNTFDSSLYAMYSIFLGNNLLF